jgi:hypothetical protein
MSTSDQSSSSATAAAPPPPRPRATAAKPTSTPPPAPALLDLTIDNITPNAVRINSQSGDARLTYLMSRLVTHLHDFARETRLSTAEWMAAIGFLIETGKICSDVRNVCKGVCSFIQFSRRVGLLCGWMHGGWSVGLRRGVCGLVFQMLGTALACLLALQWDAVQKFKESG